MKRENALTKIKYIQDDFLTFLFGGPILLAYTYICRHRSQQYPQIVRDRDENGKINIIISNENVKINSSEWKMAMHRFPIPLYDEYVHTYGMWHSSNNNNNNWCMSHRNKHSPNANNNICGEERRQEHREWTKSANISNRLCYKLSFKFSHEMILFIPFRYSLFVIIHIIITWTFLSSKQTIFYSIFAFNICVNHVFVTMQLLIYMLFMLFLSISIVHSFLFLFLFAICRIKVPFLYPFFRCPPGMQEMNKHTLWIWWVLLCLYSDVGVK